MNIITKLIENHILDDIRNDGWESIKDTLFNMRQKLSADDRKICYSNSANIDNICNELVLFNIFCNRGPIPFKKA